MKDYNNNGVNFRKKPINFSLKNKLIVFCSEFPFGILSFSSYVDIATVNIISFDVEMVNVLKLLIIPLF